MTPFAIALLLTGFLVAYEMGKTDGFKRGTEWALVQADVIAREAGVFMPVYLENGKFRVVLKQPRGLYKKAWEQADRHEETRKPLQAAKLKSPEEQQAPSNDI
jgi:hypothetical protein